MKRLMALLLSLCLLCGCGMNSAVIDTAAEGLNTSAGSLTTGDLSDFEAGEFLVGYTDGTYQVFSCENESDLVAALEELSLDESVSLIQPNYSYVSMGLPVDDVLVPQQWALNNDGSFKMEESKNRHPVYETPFGMPAAPGQWVRPGDFGRPGGYRSASYRMTANPTVSAMEGIDINAEEAWAVYSGGSRDVIVAVIDTGIDYTHEDLQGAVWTNPGEIAGNSIDDDGNGYIDDVYGWNFYDNSNKTYVNSSHDAHGTHGAGTIAATAGNGIGIAGIADSEHVKIMSLKALGGSSGSGSTASIIQAIQYAQANGASICNLSLGSSVNDQALYRVMANSSMLFVVAAGNDGVNTDKSPSYPASYDLENIISVANLNYDGSLHSSSNYGAVSVDIAAPGSYILSTTPENGYSYMTGTSMATPMVTAAAAMLYSHYEDITLADVKEVLLASAGQLDTLDGSVLTGGMLDLGAAMNWDMGSLSGQRWDNFGDTGTAPEITAQVFSRWGTTYVQIQVTDDDLMLTAYGQGTLTAQDFQQGTEGIVFETDESGVAVFTASSSGIYTFYALDARGNETVQTVTIQVRSPGPMQPLPSMPGGGWGFARPVQHRYGR